MAFNKYQQFILDNYEGGEFAHVKTQKNLKTCGDTLPVFLVNEMEDCPDAETMVGRLEQAWGQVEKLAIFAREELEEGDIQ